MRRKEKHKYKLHKDDLLPLNDDEYIEDIWDLDYYWVDFDEEEVYNQYINCEFIRFYYICA